MSSGLELRTAPWGKSSGGAHPLICHLIDTAVVAERLYPILLGPVVRRELEKAFRPLGAGRVSAWVAVWCGLHDIGKLIPVFQALNYPLALDRLGDRARPDLDRARSAVEGGFRLDLKHGDATAAYLLQRFQSWGMDHDVAIDVARAIGDHHGFGQHHQKVRQSGQKEQHLGGPEWLAARDRMTDLLHQLWGLPVPSDLDWSMFGLTLPALVGLSGLTTISDWLASGKNRFPRTDISDAGVADYRTAATARADQVLSQLNWRPWVPPSGAAGVPSYADVFDGEPRELQRRVVEFIEHRDRPGILVIEAPTGEGKTEAGLLAAAGLAHRLGIAGLYIGMPTKALAGEKLEVVNRMLRFTGSPLRARSVHTDAWSKDRVLTPVDLSEEAPEQDKESAEELAEAAEWFRWDVALAASIGVGTVDQALKAVFRARFAPMRLANLSNKVLIFDEVHAYDTYTSRLLYRLLWWCGRLGILVVLLAATLPARQREELLAEWQAGARDHEVGQVRELPAPGWHLTWSDVDGRDCRPVTSALSSRTIELLRLDDSRIPGWVVERVAESGTAMLVYSTKQRAWEGYQAIRHLVGDDRGIELVHLDSNVGARQRAERKIRLDRSLGKQASAPRHLIVVGTSLLENLDLDVDLMVSDICPTDLLIQRIGRLHRYPDVPRPAHLSTPTLVLAGMENQRGRKGAHITFPGRIAHVFGRAVLEASWAVLDPYDRLTLPDQVSDLVQRTYGDDQPLTRARENQLAKADRDEFQALTRCIPRCMDDQFELLTHRRTGIGATRLKRAPARPENAGG